MGRAARCNARERIYTKGSPAREVFILSAGEAINSFTSSGGQEFLLQCVCPGDIVPITALLGDDVYQTDCIANQACEFTRLEVSAARNALRIDPQLSFHVLELALKRLRRRSQQLTDSAFLPVRGRVCKWLLERAAEQSSKVSNGTVLDLKGSDRLIGLALGGVSRETISRHLSALTKGQVISRSGKQIIIRDAAKLRAMVEPSE